MATEKKTYFVKEAYYNANGNLSQEEKTFSVFGNALSQWGAYYKNLINQTEIQGFCLGIFCTDGSVPNNRQWQWYDCPEYVEPTTEASA